MREAGDKVSFPRGDSGSRSVLFVDRAGHFKSNVSAILSSKPYDVLEASTAEDCLQTLDARRPGVVLIGLNFAVNEALTLTRVIKNSPEHRFTSVLLIASDDMADRVAEWKQAGVTAWIKEPFTPEQLFRIIDMVTF